MFMEYLEADEQNMFHFEPEKRLHCPCLHNPICF